jgi:beta-galactosidase/beta-glucuronidase
VRERWLCLNGAWQFEIDASDTGLERGLLERALAHEITVPFCPESPLSGIDNQDYLNAVWYRREVRVPEDWECDVVLLHFQAVDYDATVWVDGVEVGRHRGGFTPFTLELAKGAGDVFDLTVRARDTHTEPQPRGKQAMAFREQGAIYRRTTGIWQTVWIEPAFGTRLERPRVTPDVVGGRFWLEQPIVRGRRGMTVSATLTSDGAVVAESSVATDYDLAPSLSLDVPEAQRRLWSPRDPHLYDLEIVLCDGDRTVDRVTSYAGLRSVGIDGKAITLNGERVFQRLVLDQGYYPDGILTAPTDAALIEDIQLSQAAGFNGARLHQKVFEERFLYHADRLGYLVWGEFADWGCRGFGPGGGEHQKPGPDYITQWLEVLHRDYSHPAIVGWCPLNETWQGISDRITVLDDVTRGMFLATKAMDATRPVLDASGYSHRVPEADVYDSHDYVQDVEQFRARHANARNDAPLINERARPVGPPLQFSIPYRGQPFFVSEFGGIWWNPDLVEGEESWGYGNRPKTLEEFYERFEGLCRVLLDDPSMFGYCYTQLTDVFQEQNGIYKFDRKPKFDAQRLRAIQTAPAAFEG